MAGPVRACHALPGLRSLHSGGSGRCSASGRRQHTGRRARAAAAAAATVEGVAASDLRDTFADGRDGNQRGHEAIDILAPRGTPVLAVADGPIVKLFLSQPGGITIYQFDTTGQLAYYYAHLDRYAPGLAEGQMVRRGSVMGYVGSTGNASPDAPHLHFAIFRLGPEKQWWKGEPINPFGYLGGKQP